MDGTDNDKASGKEAGRISRRGPSLGRSFAQTADVRIWSKAIVGAEADGERERTPHCPRRVSGRAG